MKMGLKEGEAWGLLQAIKWINIMGFTHVILESDWKKIVDDICSKRSRRTEYGFTMDECRSLLSLCNYIKVVFARRLTNNSANCIARASILNAPCTIYSHVP